MKLKKKKEEVKKDVPDSICLVRCVKCKTISKISRADIKFFVCPCGSSLYEVDVK